MGCCGDASVLEFRRDDRKGSNYKDEALVLDVELLIVITRLETPFIFLTKTVSKLALVFVYWI